MKVVTTWNDDDELGRRVARFDDVRCEECGRALFCLNWDYVGYPEVHCPACDIRMMWPFEDRPELRARYEKGPDAPGWNQHTKTDTNA